MATQNILPSLQADEKTAHLGVRSVHIPNGLLETGRMLTDAGQGLQRASFGLALGLKRQRDAMQAEENALALAEAKVNYLRETTPGITELLKKQGDQAVGITNEYTTMSQNACDRQLRTLDPKSAREFKIWFAERDLTGKQKVQGHEFTTTLAARTTAEQQVMGSSEDSFGFTGNILDLNAAIQSHDRLWAMTHGGITTDSDLQEFLRQNPNATPEELAPYEESVRALNTSRQAVIDESYGKRMQVLLDQGDIAGATSFYESLGKDGIPDASKAARDAMRVPLENRQRGLEAKFRASRSLTNIYSSSGVRSLGGQFMTEEMVTMVMDRRAELQRSNDPRDQEELVAFDAQWAVDQKRMAANRAAAQANVTSGLFRNPYDPVQYAQDLETFQDRINSMPPTIAREDAEDIYNNALKHYTSLTTSRTESQRAEEKRIMDERKKDPARQVLESYLVNNIACMSEPVFTIGSGADYTEFDGRDPEKLWAFLVQANIKYGGPLTDEAANQIWMLCTQQIPAEPRKKAVARVGRLFQDNFDYSYNVEYLADAAPWLIDYAINSAYRLSNDGKYTDKNTEDAIDRDVLLEMKRKFYVQRWDGFDFWETANIIKRAIKADGTINYQELENAFGWPRYRTGRKATGPNGPTGGLSDKETDKEIQDERNRINFGIYGAQGGTGQDLSDLMGGVR